MALAHALNRAGTRCVRADALVDGVGTPGGPIMTEDRHRLFAGHRKTIMGPPWPPPPVGQSLAHRGQCPPAVFVKVTPAYPVARGHIGHWLTPQQCQDGLYTAGMLR